jgi:hypothetical protein
MLITRAADLLWLPAVYEFGDLFRALGLKPCSRLAAFAPTASQASVPDNIYEQESSGHRRGQ